jgi:Fic family protein
MEKFFNNLKRLVKTKLSLTETLYYASILHLVLLKIHPFEDGNGRMARLLEKWFLASQLGPEAWNIPIEQYYYQNLSAYYRNVHIGFDYEAVDYQRSLPFLFMLPQAIQHQP